MDRFFIYAKPKIKDVKPYSLGVYNQSLTSIQNFNFLVRGESFFDIRSVYLSTNNPSMFDDITFYDPFSASIKLAGKNPSFYALKVPFFIYKEKYLAFTLPQIPKATGKIDIIIENEAGYSLMTRDTRMPFISSYNGAVDIQLPCVSGINITDLVDFFAEYTLLASNNDVILTSQEDKPITVAFYS